jgi:hypothetical protein
MIYLNKKDRCMIIIIGKWTVSLMYTERKKIGLSSKFCDSLNEEGKRRGGVLLTKRDC